jgi:hypothetical protein
MDYKYGGMYEKVNESLDENVADKNYQVILNSRLKSDIS